MSAVRVFIATALLGFAFCGGNAGAIEPAGGSSQGSKAATARPTTGSQCAAMLQMSSTDWVAHYGQEHGTTQQDALKAIDVYAKCYDARTTRLAATLGTSGKGPLMGANGSFRDFQAALKDFSAKALTDTDPPADPVRLADASLYALQFRYEFLENYAQKSDRKRPLTDDESDEMAKAKNRFGELLGLLKPDQFHEVHSAFSKVLELVNNDVTKLEVYRYGIFLLARPGEKPFSAPPF